MIFPFQKIKVLIVDDSVIACKILAEALSRDDGIEVAATALSGPIALSKLEACSPDIVMLDVEMPVMDGLQTLREIKKIRPALPVIMCSVLTKVGNRHTMLALQNGAADYITKPTSLSGRNGGIESFTAELIAKIKSICNSTAHIGHVGAQKPETETGIGGIHADILAIGVSTGGPNALSEFLPGFPPDFPVPIVIVQHMPPLFTKSLADSLTGKSQIEVREAFAGALLIPGKAWLAPGGLHMTVVKVQGQNQIAINSNPPVNSCRPSVDVLFQSVAEVFGKRVLGVVLTGMGQDGLVGSAAIREAGGRIYVQDEATSVVWGMPGAVAKAGLADKVLPLHDLATEIINGFSKHSARPKPRVTLPGGL